MTPAYPYTHQEHQDRQLRLRLRIAAFLCDFLLYTIHMVILHVYLAPRIYALGYAPSLVVEGTYAYGGRLAYVLFSFWLVGDALGERDWYFTALISFCVPIAAPFIAYYAINTACI